MYKRQFLYTAFFFSTDHSFFLYTSLNLQKLIVIGLGIAANILLIGRLQWQFERSSMEKMQAEAEEKPVSYTHLPPLVFTGLRHYCGNGSIDRLRR